MATDEQSPFSDLEDALKKSAAVLRGADVPFLLGGSLASWARGGPETHHDLDLMIKPEDAERALQALVEAGMRPEDPPEEWLVKAWDGDVLVDLMFEPSGVVVDDEFLEQCELQSVAAVRMRVMPLEDLLVGKLLALTEHHLDFAPILEHARALREQVDWSVVARRTDHSPFARAFLYMIADLGIRTEDVDVTPAREREERWRQAG